MQVIVADVLGMCFGVRDALAVIEDIERPEPSRSTASSSTTRRCSIALRRAASRWSRRRAASHLPLTDTVLITAHGVSDKERRRLREAGKQLIDTTCPARHPRPPSGPEARQGEADTSSSSASRGTSRCRASSRTSTSYDIVENVADVVRPTRSGGWASCARRRRRSSWPSRSRETVARRTRTPISCSSTPSAIRPRTIRAPWTTAGTGGGGGRRRRPQLEQHQAAGRAAAASAACRRITSRAPTIWTRSGSTASRRSA